MLASCMRQPGMSSVHHELLTHLELLGGGGPDVMLVAAQAFGLQGELTFAQLAPRVRAAGHTLLGVRLAATEKPELNPPPQTRYELGPSDGLVVVG